MQRYPSIARDHRAGGSGAAPAGGSYRGNLTAGEVPQWLVDTCNEDNEYDEEYEYQQQDDYDYYGYNSSHISHYHRREAASRKSSLDTLETFRADNTTAGIASRLRQLRYSDEYGDHSSNVDYADADDGSRQNPYMFEPYDEHVEDYYHEQQVEEYYPEDHVQDDYYGEERMNDYGTEQQAQVPPRQTFQEYQRYVMEQQQYLPSKKQGKGVVGRSILDAVGGFLNDRMMALQKQGQSTFSLMGSTRNLMGSMAGPPRQSSMRHPDGILRGGRYQKQQQQQQQQRSQRQMAFQDAAPSQQQPLEEPPPTSKQEELMMMELSGDAIPIRGGGGDRRGIERQRSQRPATPAHWDASNSGSRFATSRWSVHSSESSISSSSLSSRRALRYHDPEYKQQEEAEEDDYVGTNGKELICGWGHEDEFQDGDVGRYTAGAGSYDMRPQHPPPRASHPRYQRQQYYSSGSAGRSQSQQQMYDQKEPEAYESFQDMLPRREGVSSKDKLVGMVKKQVNFRSPEFSRPPLVPSGRGRPVDQDSEAMQRYLSGGPTGRNEMLPRRQEPTEQVPAQSHIQTMKQQLLEHSRNNNSLTSLTNYEIETKTQDGGQSGPGGKERRVSDVTNDPMLELLNLNGSKGSLTSSSLNDSGSLNADQIAEYTSLS